MNGKATPWFFHLNMVSNITCHLWYITCHLWYITCHFLSSLSCLVKARMNARRRSHPTCQKWELNLQLRWTTWLWRNRNHSRAENFCPRRTRICCLSVQPLYHHLHKWDMPWQNQGMKISFESEFNLLFQFVWSCNVGFFLGGGGWGWLGGGWDWLVLAHTARNGRLDEGGGLYRLDASLSSSCIKPVGFIKLHQICENQTWYLQTCIKLVNKKRWQSTCNKLVNENLVLNSSKRCERILIWFWWLQGNKPGADLLPIWL